MANMQIYDTAFRSYFNNPKRFLSLGNAILLTNYQNEADVLFNTLQETMYGKLKNDISCLLGGFFLVITEHQSTINPNMPLRFLLYAAELYQQIIAMNKRAIYGSKLINLPVPRFIIFYDGVKPMEDFHTLNLSKSFGGDNKYLEAKTDVYNITIGQNQELKKRCDYLRQYSEFTAYYRKARNNSKDPNAAVRDTIKFCNAHNIMTDWLKEHESEVFRMLHFEWNDDDAREVWREEAYEDGREEGLAKGREEGLEQGLERGLKQGSFNTLIDISLKMLKRKTPIGIIMELVNLPRETIEKIAKDNNLPITV